MKKGLVLFCAAILLAGPSLSSAAVILSDDFESGTDGWSLTSASLATDHSVSPTHSLKTTSSTSKGFQLFGQELPAANSMMSVYIYQAGTSRTYAWIGGYGSSGIENILAIGASNTVRSGDVYNGTKYQGHIHNGTGMGWFNLDDPGSPNRSDGWHKFTIEIAPDGVTTKWYVDDILSRTIVAPQALPTWDRVYLGSGLTPAPSGTNWFDDITVATIPDPGSVSALLIASGLLFRRRR